MISRTDRAPASAQSRPQSVRADAPATDKASSTSKSASTTAPAGARVIKDGFDTRPVPTPRAEARAAALTRGASPESLWSVASGAGAARTLATGPIPQVDLKRGDSGEAVGQLQDRLVDAGFMSAEQIGAGRGSFGPKTEAAVRAFQGSAGVPVTGAFDGATRAAMVQKLGGQPADLTENQKLVSDAYNKVLLRDADAGGLQSWSAQLDQLAGNGATPEERKAFIENALSQSEEGQVVATVQNAFTEVLGRTPDRQGFWHQKAIEWKQQGQSLEQISGALKSEFRNSEEYKLGHLGDMVKQQYQELLGREADPDGLKTWTDAAEALRAQGKGFDECRDLVRNGIMGSEEYKQKHPDAQLQRPTGLAEIKAEFGEAGKNMVTLRLPFGNQGALVNVVCNAKIAPLMEQMGREMQERGLTKFINSFDGMYPGFVRNKRDAITGKELQPPQPSVHSWGIAFDINANPRPGHVAPELVEYFKSKGFIWGGDFTGNRDPMHFQFADGY